MTSDFRKDLWFSLKIALLSILIALGIDGLRVPYPLNPLAGKLCRLLYYFCYMVVCHILAV